MAKKNYDWGQAKALYGMGKTPRQIEKTLGIPFSTVQRMAAKEEWVKGGLNQLSQDVARVVEDLNQKKRFRKKSDSK